MIENTQNEFLLAELKRRAELITASQIVALHLAMDAARDRIRKECGLPPVESHETQAPR